MQVNYKKAIEVNNEHELKVDEQQEDIDDEVQETTAAKTQIKKNMPGCVTCNKTFVMRNRLKKTYSGRTHFVWVKLVWQTVQKEKEST